MGVFYIQLQPILSTFFVKDFQLQTSCLLPEAANMALNLHSNLCKYISLTQYPKNDTSFALQCTGQWQSSGDCEMQG